MRSETASPSARANEVCVPAAPASVATGAAEAQHILFGSVEDLLADLQDRGAPDGHIVRVERLVRSRRQSAGGVATQGVLVTARRHDEVLSAWVIVGRLALDPQGQPQDQERARTSAQRHHDAQRVIGAQVADAGFAVRTGLYLLPDAGYGFAATSASLEARAATALRNSPFPTPHTVERVEPLAQDEVARASDHPQHIAPHPTVEPEGGDEDA